MAMRTAESVPAMPVVSRAIEGPRPVYAPPDAPPEVPLLGMRSFEAGFTAGDRTVSGEANISAPEPQPSTSGGSVVQRTAWSHMPTSSVRQDGFTGPHPSAPPKSAEPASSEGAAATPPHSAPITQRSVSAAATPVAQRLAVPMPIAAMPAPEPAPAVPEAPQQQPVEATVQRVAVATAPPPVTVQATETAPAAVEPEPAGADPGELLAVLYEPLVRRLRADLRVDRERRGRLTDL